LARLIGRDPAVVAEFRRRVFSGGDGRRGRWVDPPPPVIELWREEARGHTVSELVHLWRLTLQGVQHRLKRYGLAPAPPRRGGPRTGHKRVATAEAVERWREDAVGRTLKELAAHWGVPISTAVHRVYRFELPIERHRRGTPPEIIDKWRRDAEGRTVRELAQFWGVPEKTAASRVYRHALPARIRKLRRRDPEEMRRQAEGRTVAQLAQSWGVSKSRAYQLARRHHLPVKRRAPHRPQRDVEQLRRDAEGRTVSELAELWGVTRQRAHQLVMRHGLPAKVRRRKRRTSF
jgi:Zn-dependent peptidase ImmA (M78 family)